jgi:hypothetical protein
LVHLGALFAVAAENGPPADNRGGLDSALSSALPGSHDLPVSDDFRDSLKRRWMMRLLEPFLQGALKEVGERYELSPGMFGGRRPLPL